MRKEIWDGTDRFRLSFELFRPPFAKRTPRTQSRLYDFFWIATGRIHEVLPAVTQVRMSAQTFALLNMTFITVLLGTVPAVRARVPFVLVLAGIAATIEVLNGIGHTAGAVWFGRYVPGVATAPALFVTGVLVWRELLRGSRADRIRTGDAS